VTLRNRLLQQLHSTPVLLLAVICTSCYFYYCLLQLLLLISTTATIAATAAVGTHALILNMLRSDACDACTHRQSGWYWPVGCCRRGAGWRVTMVSVGQVLRIRTCKLQRLQRCFGLCHTPAQSLEHAHMCVEASAVCISLLNVGVVVDSDAVQLQQSIKQASVVLTEAVIYDTHLHSHNRSQVSGPPLPAVAVTDTTVSSAPVGATPDKTEPSGTGKCKYLHC
jgi:hypothetical protein